MRRDGLYRLQTNTPVEQVSSAEVLAHYKNSRQLQCIRLGRLEVQGQSLKTLRPSLENWGCCRCWPRKQRAMAKKNIK
jgi:hypothetical protein